MPHTQMQFIRILQDECITPKGTYKVITSIYNLTYRNEVFLDGQLIDALEEECYYLIYDPKKEEYFKNKYINAQQAIKNKYCKLEEEIPSRTKKAIPSFNIPKLDYLKLSKIFSGGLFSFILLFFIKNSITNPPKDIPPVAISEKKISLPEISQDMENTYTPEIPIVNKVEKELLPNIVKEKDMFIWTPAEDFAIDEAHYFSLSFRNNSNSVVSVELTGRTLKQSAYDEIIQFKNSDIYAEVQTGGTKIFQIYIEPTYYKQFNKGKYTGTLTFTLDDTKEKTLVTKQFSFEVK